MIEVCFLVKKQKFQQFDLRDRPADSRKKMVLWVCVRYSLQRARLTDCTWVRFW